jgi:hypothetical protein
MSLNERHNKLWIGQNLPDNFPIQNHLKQGDALASLLFNLAFEYSIMKVQENHMGLTLSGTHQLLAYAENMNLLGYNIHTANKNKHFY